MTAPPMTGCISSTNRRTREGGDAEPAFGPHLRPLADVDLVERESISPGTTYRRKAPRACPLTPVHVDVHEKMDLQAVICDASPDDARVARAAHRLFDAGLHFRIGADDSEMNPERPRQ